MFLTKKKFINLNKDTFSKPALVVCNHQSLIDIPLSLMLTPKMAMITREELYNSFFLGRLLRMGGFFPASRGYDEISDNLKELVADGYSIFVFPEGTRSEDHKLKRFHKGAFYLAEQLGLDILPMVMNGTGDYIKKGERFGRRSTIAVKFLDRISADDKRYGTNYSERTKKVQEEFRREHALLRQEIHGQVDYHRDLLIPNFIYKGPVLEWYMRIKLKLEQNYSFFNEILPKKGQITDIGCGYGFLAYMMAWTSPQRRITGIDYDEEKIDVALNGISRPENTEFISGDAIDIPLHDSDAFVLADVLHYLPEERQQMLIRKCAAKLHPHGIMIIRDADASLANKHKGTRLTEFFSTKVVGFNKTGGENQLYFTSRDTVYQALENSGCTIDIVDETRFTSNIYYIIRKPANQG